MKMAQITFNLRKVDAIKLNPKYVALASIKTDNVHVKEFLSNFQSEFWIAHTIKIHQSVKVTKKTFIRDRVVVIVYKKSNFTFLHDILKLVRKYNFPENYIDKLTQEYQTCGCVMFAIEADGDNVKYKVYCETYSKGFGFGFKWTQSKCAITRYEWFKSVDNYKSWIDASGFNLYPKFLETKKITQAYSLKDQNTDKRGFEFALKDTYLKDVSNDVLLLTNVNIYDKLKDLANLPIIHFSGGLESNGDKYFNLYFVVL
jgi:hypothetical protein